MSRRSSAWFIWVCSLCTALAHCSTPEQPPPATEPPASAELSTLAPSPAPVAVPEPELSPDDRALIVEGAGTSAKERWLSLEAASAAGYTLVDLTDSWTPLLFEEHLDEAGQPLPNGYRRVFLGLANDQLDSDGQALEPTEKNYLELYGIFPSLSVLRARFLGHEGDPCADPAGRAALQALDQVPFAAPNKMQRDAATQKKNGEQLAAELKKAKLTNLTELALTSSRLAPKVKAYQTWLARDLALAAAERRLVCEGFLLDAEANQKQPKALRHIAGVYDEALRLAVMHFQQKHMIYEGHYLRPKTMQALARPSLENDYASLRRAVRERVISAAGILEDGSANTNDGPPTYVSSSGETLPVRNLAEEVADTAMQQLGLGSPEAALAFFERHPAEDFQTLNAGVKLPALPEYYSSHMDLSIVIDRGDVWYDPPFDADDKWRDQPRSRLPKLTLLLDYNGQQFPLVSWRTTVGGWRSEQAANGYEYYRYKGSDVGPRVLRKIVAGPVWIAPESTPIRSLVKYRVVQGRWQGIVNYDELGPGYLSAYGVVAGYFVIPGKNGDPDADLGIRAHGSSNYLSIYSNSGYSHGCHRLPNHLAVRLYDFLLEHRNMKVLGDEGANISRQFLLKDQVYDIRFTSRGYVYELDPPMAVNVLPGSIRGTLRQPVEGAVEKPGVRYPPPEEEEVPEPLTESPVDGTPAARAAAAAGAAAAAAAGAQAAGAAARASAKREQRGAN